ncbi:MAG: RnfH family protein [Pseudomonadota bacterium]
MAEHETTATISIEVSYALPDCQRTVVLDVAVGTTARQAALSCGLTRYFPALDLAKVPLGIWGRSVDDDALVADGDRVELYRPLRASAREQRRERAKRGGF